MTARTGESIPLNDMSTTPLPSDLNGPRLTISPSSPSLTAAPTTDNDTLAGSSGVVPTPAVDSSEIPTSLPPPTTSYARTDTAYTYSLDGDARSKSGVKSLDEDEARSDLEALDRLVARRDDDLEDDRDNASLTGDEDQDDPLVPEGGTRTTSYLVRLVLIACLSGLQFGMDTGIASGMLVAIHGELGHPLSAGEQELIVSATTAGAIMGSLCAGRLADWAGRKKAMLAAALLFLLGGLEQSASQFVQELVVGRAIQGVAVGMASMVTPTFLAEVAPNDIRGRLVGFNSLLVTGGQVVAYVIAAIFYNIPHGWRWMALSGCVPAIIQLISLIALDESPRWLIHQGRVSQARHVLSRIYPLAPFDAIEAEITRITKTFGQTAYEVQASVHAAEAERRSTTEQRRTAFQRWRSSVRTSIKHSFQTVVAQLKLLFGVPANRRALELAAGLLCFQQAIGFNSLMYFSGRLLFMAGFENPNAMAIGIAVANLLGTIGAIHLVDKVGRRQLLLWTIAPAALFLAFLAISLHNIDLKDVIEQTSSGSGLGNQPASPSGHSGWAYASLAAMILFTLCYAFGLGIIPWLVCSEVFASPVRGVGGGIATAVNWVANLVISATFLDLVRTVTASGSFWIYTGMAILAWIFTYWRLPELSGVSINDVHRAFGAGTSSSLQEQAAYQALPQQDAPVGGDANDDQDVSNQAG